MSWHKQIPLLLRCTFLHFIRHLQMIQFKCPGICAHRDSMIFSTEKRLWRIFSYSLPAARTTRLESPRHDIRWPKTPAWPLRKMPSYLSRPTLNPSQHPRRVQGLSPCHRARGSLSRRCVRQSRWEEPISPDLFSVEKIGRPFKTIERHHIVPFGARIRRGLSL